MSLNPHVSSFSNETFSDIHRGLNDSKMFLFRF